MPTQIIGGLYISDIQGVCEGNTGKFDRIISTCQDDCSDNVACEYSYELLTDAIDSVVAARLRRETVCVHCHAGVSRSAAVCIGALAIVEGMDYQDALAEVQSTKHIQPTREMLEDVQQYIEERQ